MQKRIIACNRSSSSDIVGSSSTNMSVIVIILALMVMGFITCNQRTDFLSFTKQATFTPFAMDGIVGKVNINALLLQTVLY